MVGTANGTPHPDCPHASFNNHGAGLRISLATGTARAAWLCALTDGCWRGLGAVVIMAYVQRLMPGPDRRLPSLFLAAGGLGQGAVALIPLTLWTYFHDDTAAIEAMCWLAIAAVALGLPLLFKARP